MIISDKYKYVFVEQPLTASTAIAAELIHYYDGHEVLSKHSNYSDFLAIANDNQRRYAVVIGVRNPLDQVVSGYQKLKVNHLNAYDNPALFEENGGWISKHRRRMFRFVHQEGHDFEGYFRKFFGRPRSRSANTSGRRRNTTLSFVSRSCNAILPDSWILSARNVFANFR